MLNRYVYPFTAEEANAAFAAWNCNCGPTALAFALQVKLDAVRPLIPGFKEKHYTSPSMMKIALANAGQKFESRLGHCMFSPEIALVRVQWCGPWTAPGANPRWAYCQTHWICAWLDDGREAVFDVNGGIMGLDTWKEVVVPAITANTPRADGKWFPTHVWRLVI